MSCEELWEAAAIVTQPFAYLTVCLRRMHQRSLWRSVAGLHRFARCQAAAAEAPPKAQGKQQGKQQQGGKAGAEAAITKKSEDYSRQVPTDSHKLRCLPNQAESAWHG